MNELKKILNEKRTENGDVAYTTTGNNLTDLLFMTSFFEKHIEEAKIGTSEREKLFSMFIRDPRFGLGRRDLGRRLMELSGVSPMNIIRAGRFDDLWHIPNDENIKILKQFLNGNTSLAKKWMPRLTGKDKKIAKALCKEWGITEREYRKLIKNDSTVEYKLSYAEKKEGTPLNELFKQGEYTHPLVETIDFEQVPSLAMTKYLHAFSTREDTKERFSKYIEDVKENKAKVNVATSDVTIAHKTAVKGINEASDVIAKKVVENETISLEMNAICVLDTSGSMYFDKIGGMSIGDKATSVCHAISTHSTYAPNQVISFSSNPKLMTIKGETLKDQYKSMYTGDCSNTNLAKVFELLKRLKKYPQYIIVFSDMEFDRGSSTPKNELYKIFKDNEVNTKLIWWNFNNRNKTAPEFDEYGNIYLSGYNLQILKLLENNFDMTTYIDKILDKYKKDIEYK